MTTPGAWTLGHQLDGYVDLEYRGGDVAHRVRVEVLDARRARMVTRQTIEVATLPRGMPISIPLGAVERARLYAITVEWDDSHGLDQFNRLRVDRYPS